MPVVLWSKKAYIVNSFAANKVRLIDLCIIFYFSFYFSAHNNKQHRRER